MRAVHVLTAGGLAVALASALAVWLGPYPFLDHGTLGAAASARPPPARTARVPPLLGADGTPQPALPQAVPTDPRERTQHALYATRAQARSLEADLDGAVVWIEVDCCDADALARAIELTESRFADRHFGLDAPVFVSGADLKLAALVADRLSDDGYMHVFLVTR